MPADWMALISYNTFWNDGNIILTSKVVDYDRSDVSKITNEWEPTGTFFVDRELIARKKAEKEAAEAAAAKKLKDDLERAKNEAEAQRVR
jgi:ribosomal protein L14E/L6E/L27E